MTIPESAGQEEEVKRLRAEALERLRSNESPDAARQEMRLKANDMLSRNKDPAVLGEAAEISNRYGVPPGVVAINPDIYRQRDRDAERALVASRNPRLASWLEDPDNYAVAREDISAFATIEGLFNQGVRNIGHVSKRFQAGGVRLSAIPEAHEYSNLQEAIAFYEAYDEWKKAEEQRKAEGKSGWALKQSPINGWLIPGRRNPAPNFPSSLHDFVRTEQRRESGPFAVFSSRDQLREAVFAARPLVMDRLKQVEEPLAAKLERADELVEQSTTGNYIADGLLMGAQAFVEMAPLIGAMIATRSPAVSSGVMFGQVYALESAEGGIVHGLDHQDRKTRALLQAGVEAISERFALKFFDDILRSDRGLITKLVAGGAVEQVQEQIATLGNRLVDWPYLTPDMTAGEFVSSHPYYMGQTALATLVAATGMQGTMIAVDSMGRAFVQDAVEAQPSRNDGLMVQLMDLIDGMKMRGHSPAKVEEALQVILRDKEMETTTIDLDGLAQSLQEAGLDVGEVLSQLGVSPDAISDTGALMGEFRVETAQLVASPAMREHRQVVAPHLRAGQEQATPAQKEQMRGRLEAYAQEVTEAAQERINRDVAFAEQVTEVENAVLDALQASGRVGPAGLHRNEARLASRMAATIAHAQGRDVREVWAEMGPILTGQMDMGVGASALETDAGPKLFDPAGNPIEGVVSIERSESGGAIATMEDGRQIILGEEAAETSSKSPDYKIEIPIDGDFVTKRISDLTEQEMNDREGQLTRYIDARSKRREPALAFVRDRNAIRYERKRRADAEATLEQARTEGYQGEDTGEAASWRAAVAKGLPMDRASRMARADAQGYTIEAFRGMRVGPRAGNLSDEQMIGGGWFAATPETANSYARDVLLSPNKGLAMKARLRMENPLTVDAGGQMFDRVPGSALQGLEGVNPRRNYTTQEVARLAEQQGFDGVEFRNIRADRESSRVRTEPGTIWYVADQGNVRSDMAAFDPDAAGDVGLLNQAVPDAVTDPEARAAMADPETDVLHLSDDMAVMQLDEFVAFHGTRARFDAFRTERAGSGEGAQVYGPGHYFTQSPGIAEWYRKRMQDLSPGIQLGRDGFNKADPTHFAMQEYWKARDPVKHKDIFGGYRREGDFGVAHQYAINRAIQSLEFERNHLWLPAFALQFENPTARSPVIRDRQEVAAYLEAAIAHLKSLDPKSAKGIPKLSKRKLPHGGSVYTVAVKLPQDATIQFDRPLSSQPQRVQDAFREAAEAGALGEQGKLVGLPDPDGNEMGFLVAALKTNGSPAMEIMRKHGVRGVRYLDGFSRGKKDRRGRTYNYVVFNDEDVKILDRTDKLFQTMGQQQRGGYNPSTRMMNFTEAADPSTFMHEMAHWFLNMMEKMGPANAWAQAELAKVDAWYQSIRNTEKMQAIRARYAVVPEGAGFRVTYEGEPLGPAYATQQEAESAIDWRERHEAFAETFEEYLKKGEAPVPSLRDVFHAFKNWLTRLYERLMPNERANLTPEMRDFFDRMLTVDNEIEAAAAEVMRDAETMAREMFDKGIITERQLKNVGDRLLSAKEQVKEEMLARAYEDAQKVNEQWWQKERKRVLADLTRAFDRSQTGRAYNWLGYGQWKGDVPVAESRGDLETEFYQGTNRGEAIEWQNAVAKGLPMDTPARMQRAREMEFDTDTVLYHGTSDNFLAFDPSSSGRAQGVDMGGAIFLAASPDHAEGFGKQAELEKIIRHMNAWAADNGIDPSSSRVIDRFMKLAADRGLFREGGELAGYPDHALAALLEAGGASQFVMPLYARLKNPLVITEPQNFEGQSDMMHLFGSLDKGVIRRAKEAGHDGVVFEDAVDGGKRGKFVVVFDPSNIRSVHAAFDPDASGSADLLAQTLRTAARMPPQDVFQWVNDHVATNIQTFQSGDESAMMTWNLTDAPDAPQVMMSIRLNRKGRGDVNLFLDNKMADALQDVADVGDRRRIALEMFGQAIMVMRQYATETPDLKAFHFIAAESEAKGTKAKSREDLYRFVLSTLRMDGYTAYEIESQTSRVDEVDGEKIANPLFPNAGFVLIRDGVDVNEFARNEILRGTQRGGDAGEIVTALRARRLTPEPRASEPGRRAGGRPDPGGTGDQNALFQSGRPEQTGDGGGRDPRRSHAPLAGAPNVEGATGPDPRLVSVAEQYAQSQGIDLRRQGEFVEVNADRARRIAAAYEAMEHAPNDPAVRAAYEDLIQQTIAQYRALEAAGYRFWLFDEASDPYAGNPWNAMRDLRANQSMGVFATGGGFGSGATDLNVDNNPMLADTGILWPFSSPNGEMRPVLANDLFRAVHDAFGHGLEGAGFRARGEENAWQAHVRLFTGSAIGAITSETRGQNSWLNFGPYGEANQSASVEDTVFADQKTGLMPEWTWTEGRARDFEDDPGRNVGELFQSSQAPTFYSALGRFVAQSGTARAPAAQWKGMIQNAPGVKAEEIEWTGVMDWLDTQEGPVSREDVAAFVEANGVRVEEVLNADSETTIDDNPELREEIQRELLPLIEERDRLEREKEEKPTYDGWKTVSAIAGEMGLEMDDPAVRAAFDGQEAFHAQKEWEADTNARIGELTGQISSLQNQLARIHSTRRNVQTKWSSWTLPGGQNYREMLLTLPVDSPQAALDRMGLKRGDPMTDTQRAEVQRAIETRPFTSSHWSEPNVLAHVRFKEREHIVPWTPEERAALKAWEDAQADLRAIDAELNPAIHNRSIERDTIISEMTEKYRLEVRAGRMTIGEMRRLIDEAIVPDTKSSARIKELQDRREAITRALPKQPRQQVQRVLALEEIQSDWHQAGRERGYKGAEEDRAFDAAQKEYLAYLKGLIEKYRPEGVAKREIDWEMVKLASWNPKRSEMQKLNELRKKVEDLRPRGARPPNAPFKNNAWANLVLKRMVRYAAENGFDAVAWIPGNVQNGQIVEDTGDNRGDFYDKIVPNLANKLGKKYGARVSEIRMSTAFAGSTDNFYDTYDFRNTADGWMVQDRRGDMVGETFYPTEAAAMASVRGDQGQKFWTLPLTPELAAAAMTEGFPLFQRGDPKGWGETVPPPDLPPMRLDLEAVRELYGEEAVRNLPRAIRDRSRDQTSIDSMMDIIRAAVKTLKRKPPKTLFEFIRSRKARTVAGKTTPIKQWGIRGAADELKAMDRADLINEENGIHVDMMREGAEEAGYLNEGSTVNDLLNAIDREMRGEKVYSRNDQKELEDQRFATEWKEWLDSQGIDIFETNQKKLKAEIAKVVTSTAADAVTPDQAADALGFSSGEALLAELSRVGNRERHLQQEADRAMREEFGDMMRDGTLQAEAMEAARLEIAGRNTEIEMEALSRALGQQAASNYARELARQALSVRTVKEIMAYERDLRAERRFGKQALEAVKRGDYPAALKAKQSQLVAMQMYQEGKKLAERLEKQRTDLLKYYDAEGRRKAIARDYLERIEDVLDDYELRGSRQGNAEQRRRNSAKEFVDQMIADGREAELAPEVILLADLANKTRWTDLTGEEAEFLVGAVKNLAHLGRLKGKLLDQQDKREFGAKRAELVETLEAVPSYRERPQRFTPTIAEKAASWLRDKDAQHTKIEDQLAMLDGKENGPLVRHISQRINDAMSSKIRPMMETMALMRAAYMTMPKQMRNRLHKRIEVPEIRVPGGRMTQMDMVIIGLNWGNAYNREVLAEGYGWRPEDVEAALNRHLTQEHWDFIEASWSLLETLKEPAFALQKRITGVEPKSVEASPFTLENGRKIKGGYYPIKYDGGQARADSVRQSKLDEKQMLSEMGLSFSKPMTRHGHLKERQGSGGKPVKIGIDVMHEHIENVVHDIAVREAVIDVARIIRDPAFTQAYINAAGLDQYNRLLPWLTDVATNNRPKLREFMAKEMQHLRAGSTVTLMGFKVGTTAQQFTAIAEAIPELGPVYLVRGMAETMYAGPASFLSRLKQISEMSDYMKERWTYGRDRDVRSIAMQISQPSRLRAVQQNAFAFLIWADMATGVPIWHGAYRKAMDGKVNGIEKGDEVAAIAFADRIIRRVQTSGEVQNLPEIQRGGEWSKFMTMIYSYGSKQYNRNRVRVYQARHGQISQAEFIGATMVLQMMVPLLAGILAGRLWFPGEDDDWEDVASQAGMEVYLNFVGMFPFFRDVASAAARPEFGYQMSPSQSAIANIAAASRAAAEGETFDSEYQTKQAMLALSAILKLPGAQAWITGEYVYDVVTGEEDPTEDPLDAAREMFLRDTR